jgi:hypothetical protein
LRPRDVFIGVKIDRWSTGAGIVFDYAPDEMPSDDEILWVKRRWQVANDPVSYVGFPRHSPEPLRHPNR